MPELDTDDIAAQTAPEILPDQPPFPRGPAYTSLLFSYADHVPLRLWYNSNNIRKEHRVKAINHGATILDLLRPHHNQNWFLDPLRANGLHDLVYTGYDNMPYALLMTLCES